MSKAKTSLPSLCRSVAGEEASRSLMANTVSAGAACKLNGALRLHCVQSACCLCMPFDINSTLGSNCFKAFLVLILEILQLTHIKVWMGMQMFVAMHLHLPLYALCPADPNTGAGVCPDIRANDECYPGGEDCNCVQCWWLCS